MDCLKNKFSSEEIGMKICIVNCVPTVRAKFEKWCTPDLEVTMISSYDVESSIKEKFHQFIYLKEYRDDIQLENLVIELHQINHFERLVALSESDIMRVAKLRDFLNIEGQRYFSGLIFRDKLSMQQFAKIQGLLVPTFDSAHDEESLRKIAQRVGFPLIIKPLDKSGSADVHVILSKKELEQYIREDKFGVAQVDVEQFVEGDMFHVDGIVENGKLVFTSISKYYNSLGKSTTLLDVKNNEQTVGLGDFTLSQEDEISILLKKETEKFVNNAFLSNGTIHAEFIVTPQNECYFIEIASRTGGLMITNAIEYKYGLVMNEVSFYLQLGKKISIPQKIEDEQFGFLVLYPQNKELIHVDEKAICQYPNVLEFHASYELGKRYLLTEYMNNIGVIIFKGRNSQEMEDMIVNLTNFVDNYIEWKN